MAPLTSPPVVILGKHITALGVLRTLARRRVETFVVDQTDDIITRSRFYRPLERTLAETTDSAALATYLESLSVPRAVLIACSDGWAAAVAGLPSETSARFPASIGSRDVVEQLTDKARFRLLVERLDVPAPRSLLIELPRDLERATDDEIASGFLKPTDSQTYARRFGTKGAFPRSRSEAVRLAEQGRAAGVTFMLQEWIPGGCSNSVLVDGFMDRHGRIRGISVRRRVRMDPPRLANTASSVTIPMAEVGDARAITQRLLEAIGYRGVFNVEFKFDASDARFKIIEVNPRPFWHVAHVARAGIDLTWMSYLDAQGLDVPAARAYEVGRYGLYEIPDAAAIARDLFAGRRPEGAVARAWLRGEHAAFQWSDPMPGLIDIGRATRRRAREAFSSGRGAT